MKRAQYTRRTDEQEGVAERTGPPRWRPGSFKAGAGTRSYFFGDTRISVAVRTVSLVVYITVTCEPSIVARPEGPWAPVIFVASVNENC